MPESHIPSQESKASRFIRESGQVYDPEHKLWAPARWVVQMVQYLIALIILTIAEGFKAIVSGQSPKNSTRRQAAAQHARSE